MLVISWTPVRPRPSPPNLPTCQMSYKLSEGHYGCVYIPPLMCSDKKQPSITGKMAVSKVQKNTFSQEELKLVDKVRRLPLATHYFLLPEPTICHLNASQKATVTQTCESAEDVPFNRLTQITIPYGGQSLRTAKINFKTFSFKNFLRHLLEGVALLARNHLLHADIHAGNVLLSDTNVPMLIDFAKLTSFNETSESVFRTRFLAFEAGHEQLPPEALLISGLHLTPKTLDQLIEVIPNMLEISAKASNFLNYSREEQQQDLRLFLRRFKEENPQTFLDLPTFWRNIAPKFDGYSVGVASLNLLQNFLRSPYFAERQYSVGRPTFEKVIRGLISFNPYTRLSPEEALKILSGN